MTRFSVLPAGLAVAAAATLAVAQAPVPVFRSEVTYVEVDVRVTDDRGEFVRGLTLADFELLEDGKPRPIAAFNLVDLPVERLESFPGRAAAPPADVRSNARPFEGRVYVMVIDDLHMGFARTGQARRAAREFVEKRMGANDLMAVVHTAGSRDQSQELTSDKALLLAAVDRTTGRGLRSATASRIDYYNLTQEMVRRQPAGQALPGQDTAITDPDEALRAHNARATLDTLRGVAEFLSAVRGRRKAILFISEGISYDFNNPFENRSSSLVLDELRDTLAAAARANVVFYGIDPRGLTGLADEEIQMSSAPLTEDPRLSISAGLREELRNSQQSLQTLSEETGGFAVINANEFADTYERIVRENSSYYVLAYDPPDHKPDGKFHKIEVRVKRPGLKVEHRRGYASPRGKPKAPGKVAGNPQIHAALNSPLPVKGLTLSVFAVPFRAGSGKAASVLIGTEVAGRELSLAETGQLEVSSLAVDAKGEVRGGSTETVSFALRPQSKERIRGTGLRVFSRFPLPPGRHQLRVAAHDAGNDRTGSVVLDLSIPDFHKEPLAISGIAIASAMAQSLPTARPDAELGDALPAAPSALREFLRNDQAIAYAEVYDNEKAPHTLEVTTTVTRLEDGSVVLRSSEEHSSGALKDRRVAVTTTLPLPDLADGTYVLKIAARTRTGSATAAREVPFTVVGMRTPARPQ